jgi:outer membrane protein assembly factor BamE
MTVPRPFHIMAVAVAVFLAACSGGFRLSPYRIDVRQGNMVTQEMVAKLRPGMTMDQVRFVLGTPLITDIFHADRWDYVYRFQPGLGEVVERKITVFFADGKLVRVAGDVSAVAAGKPDGSAEEPVAEVPDEGVPQAVDAVPGAAPPVSPQE